MYDCQSQHYFLRYHASLSPFEYVPFGCGIGKTAQGSVCAHEDAHVQDIRERLEGYFTPLEAVPHETVANYNAFGRVQTMTFSHLINAFINQPNALLH